MQIEVKPIAHGQLDRLRIVLLSEGLPAVDILKAPVRFFEACTDNGAAIGWGGLEIYGDQAVMRSVVINSVLRGTGAGKALVETLISEAKALNLKKLWLLTTNAENFFAKLGFCHAIRSEAPKEIQDCEEFKWPNNETAHCMNMRL
jgi:N-acetylglutamate synthase-like GNAT family acetyltransferase